MNDTTSPAAVFWASLVRTLVPVLAGAIITWLTRLGLTTDAEFSLALESLLMAGFTVLYYAAARLLETYVAPKFGWLLGYAKSPTAYTPGKHVG